MNPLAIYNRSLGNILEKFGYVLETVINLTRDETRGTDWNLRMQIYQTGLLHALMEHMDDCESILQCFYRKGIKLNVCPPIREFKRSTHDYRTYIGKIVNHLKHSQGRLRSFAFFDDIMVYPGYFVEGPDDKGVLGPAPHIHKGGNTAFSFSRDLRYHFFSVYMVSHHLACATLKITANAYQHCRLVPDASRIIRVASMFSKLPLVFFPDEMGKHIPTVTFEQTAGDFALVLRYPDSTAHAARIPSGVQCVACYAGDGVSSAFRLPYFRPRN